MICPECGSPVTPAMKFCSECGVRLDPGSTTVSYLPTFVEEEVVPSTSRPPENGASLVELDQVEGTAGRRMHDLGANTVHIGRSPECDISLDDVTVSRKHADISRSERSFRIKDAGSLNGTYVNRVRVDTVDLRNGDEIQIGKYRFKFVFN